MLVVVVVAVMGVVVVAVAVVVGVDAVNWLRMRRPRPLEKRTFLALKGSP